MPDTTDPVDETIDDQTTVTTDTAQADGPAEDWAPPSRDEHETLVNELNRLKRTVADAAKARKDAERAARQAEQEKAKQDGNWQKLAEEREQELAEARQQADEALGKLAAYERQQTVTQVAATLNFRDPQDAYRFLQDDEQADAKLAEAALKRLKKDKPYLIAEPRRTGVDQTDAAPPSGDSSPEQQHNAWLAKLLAG